MRGKGARRARGPGRRFRALGAAAERPLTALPGEITVERLDNGLTVCLLENRQAPTVTCALWYRAGTRDDADGCGGTAHFLEHMMFKGSSRYGAGEIDRLTQALGGSNNAFTSFDATTYYFNFARDRWRKALSIEADRMAGLTLDSGEVASERQVIQEEIAMYDADPWDALEQRVRAILFGDHPYGRPVLGTEVGLEAIGAEELAAFHRDFYRPDNAVLVIAGDLDEGALEAVAATLGTLPGGARPRPEHPPAVFPRHLVRLERRQGEVPRVLLALPAPAAKDPDSPAVRLLGTLLAGGRSSRLHRRLVDEEQLCSSVAVDVTESLDAGLFAVAAELVPDSESQRVEEELMRLLAGLTETVPEAGEVERARRILLADWVFGHERIYSQALAAGFGLALFDLEHSQRQLERMLAVEPGEIREVARRVLRPQEVGVLGWSLPSLREGGDE